MIKRYEDPVVESSELRTVVRYQDQTGREQIDIPFSVFPWFI
jgi:hypothetical protein